MDNLLSWLIEDCILMVTLPKNLRHDQLEKINQAIHHELDQASDKLIVFLNAEDMITTYQTADMLRATQTYVKHKNLDCVMVTPGNKLNRLIVLMAFSTALVPVMQFDNMRGVNEYLQRRGIPLPDTKCG